MLGASLGLMACLVVQAEPSREPGGSAKDESLEQVIQREDPVRWELGVRVESRTGRPESSDASSHLTEVEVDPLAALRVPFRPGEFTISYEPRLVIIAHQTPVEPTQRAYYLNRGRLVLDIRPDEKWRVFVNARAAYGEYDFSPLSGPSTSTSGTGAPPTTPGTPGPPTPNPGPSTLPEERFVLAIDLDGSVGMVHFFNPSVGYLLSAGYTYSGGADAAAREQLPLQKGPKASTGVLWTVNARDNLSFLVDGSHSRFSSGPIATVVDITTRWTRTWSRSFTSELIGGIGTFNSSAPATASTPAHEEDSVLPVVGIGLRDTPLTRGFSWRNSLTFLAAPLPDRINGIVYERLSGVFRSSLAPSEKLAFDLSAGASMSVSGEQRDARVELKMTYLFLRQVGMSLGGRTAWIQGSPGVPNGFGWVGFLAIGAYLGDGVLGAPL
jgi:hypothetical protein